MEGEGGGGGGGGGGGDGGGLLAPGFRFHPTDEELVSYYLKRKVTGRPLRVDPISDVDLYRQEPWDLPSMSRLRTRDMEWYFFSPLDRKYSSRSRTNRATPNGYWKTTGKDRPVRRGSQVVGMKKTLVYHSGRAPRGQRTNWVMHEYRLEDESLAKAGVPQDGFVVCRIFQKMGAGPMNGAQYGAPFVEEEWDELGDDLVVQNEVGNGMFLVRREQEYLQMDDLEPGNGLDIQQENEAIITVGSNEQVDGNHFEDLEDILQDQNLFSDLNGGLDILEIQNVPELVKSTEENPDVADQSPDTEVHINGYVELNDLMHNEAANHPCNEASIDGLLGVYDGQVIDEGRGDTSNTPLIDFEQFFDTNDNNADFSDVFQMSPSVQNDMYPVSDTEVAMPGDHPFGQSAAGNSLVYDAPSHYPASVQENSAQVAEQHSTIAEPHEFDMMDELMAYFDATDANLHYDVAGTSEMMENVDSSVMDLPNYDPQASVPNHEKGESSARGPNSNIMLSSKNEYSFVAPGAQKEPSFTKRLVNMLGSIHSPPAFASEDGDCVAKTPAQNSATSSSSIHVTAGMFHISHLKMTESSNEWPFGKNGDMGFLLSYGVASNSVIDKQVGIERVEKMHCRAFSVVWRGGIYLCFLSALILGLSCKIGCCILGK